MPYVPRDSSEKILIPPLNSEILINTSLVQLLRPCSQRNPPLFQKAQKNLRLTHESGCFARQVQY